MKSKVFSLLLISILFLSCQGQNAQVIQTIDAKTFSEKLKATENPQLIDVRTPDEFKADKIGKARNINWNGEYFASQAEKLDKSKPVFVYCKVGGRSAEAANKLAELGFTEIYNLDGGIMKWNAAGLTPPKKRIGITAEEYQNLLNTDKKVLIDFSAQWCGPCKKMAPYLDKLSEEMKDELVIIKIDTDKDRSIAEDMGVEGLPTLILYKDKKIIWRNLGYISEEDLKKHL